MKAIFFFCAGFRYLLSSFWTLSSSFSSSLDRQAEARSFSWLLGPFLGRVAVFVARFSPSSSDPGSFAVGVWKGMERKRIDSILAVGKDARMCRWRDFFRDYIGTSLNPQQTIVLGVHTVLDATWIGKFPTNIVRWSRNSGVSVWGTCFILGPFVFLLDFLNDS